MDPHLHDALQAAGETAEHCAWFRTADSMALDHDLHELEHLSLGLEEVVLRKAANPLPPEEPHVDRRDLGDHVAVAVTSDYVTVWSCPAHHVLGHRLATFRKGEFRGHFHHYPERVDLVVEDQENGRIYLTGSWTHFDDECLHTARAVADMAAGPAH